MPSDYYQERVEVQVPQEVSIDTHVAEGPGEGLLCSLGLGVPAAHIGDRVASVVPCSSESFDSPLGR